MKLLFRRIFSVALRFAMLGAFIGIMACGCTVWTYYRMDNERPDLSICGWSVHAGLTLDMQGVPKDSADYILMVDIESLESGTSKSLKPKSGVLLSRDSTVLFPQREFSDYVFGSPSLRRYFQTAWRGRRSALPDTLICRVLYVVRDSTIGDVTKVSVDYLLGHERHRQWHFWAK